MICFKKNGVGKCNYYMMLLLTSFVMFSCGEKDELVEANIELQSESTITFSPNDTENEKTVLFSSSKPWKLAPIEVDWIDATPKEGAVGAATLIIKLIDTEIVEDRSTEIKIISDHVSEVIKIDQVTIAVENIEFITPPEVMTVGAKFQLQFKITPGNATVKEVEWSSSDETIILVGQEGKIEALRAGSATITVSVNGESATCEIEVEEPDNVFTFKKLSSVEGSGVTVEDDAYVVSENLEFDEGTILRLYDNETVKLKNGVEIKVAGTIDFTPEAGALVTRYDDESTPKSIYLTGEEAGGSIKNVTFIDVPFRLFAGENVSFDNCEFKYISSSRAALDMGTNKGVQVTNCKFIENRFPAIAGATNGATPLVFKNNYLYKNVTYNGNRPQINVTVGGVGIVEISDNEVIGPAEITRSGGIAVNNLFGISGLNKIIISGNKISDCRYGITTNGVMDVEITGNEIIDNKYEDNPMNGGSGISIYNSNGGQKVKISENTIKGNLWGVTLIGSVANNKGPEVNMGNLTDGPNYNIGKNIFEANGNGGVEYALYNNSPIDVAAVNNTWGVLDQTEAEIEKVIVHENDDPALGAVTFMPPFQP